MPLFCLCRILSRYTQFSIVNEAIAKFSAYTAVITTTTMTLLYKSRQWQQKLSNCMEFGCFHFIFGHSVNWLFWEESWVNLQKNSKSFTQWWACRNVQVTNSNECNHRPVHSHTHQWIPANAPKLWAHFHKISTHFFYLNFALSLTHSISHPLHAMFSSSIVFVWFCFVLFFFPQYLHTFDLNEMW